MMREILGQLVAFDTVSHRPNMALMGYVRDLLEAARLTVTLVPDAGGGKANLFASTGPGAVGGVMLSGHTDVVPVEGQDWTVPPFALTEARGRYYGRGAADMKGFVACAVEAMLLAARRPLKVPLHLALSYDEEIGCMGVRSLIDLLAAAPVKPRFCIVGEPTGMQVATGHKGKVALRATCRGREGHSALAPLALNALHLSGDFLGAVRRVQAEVAATGLRDGDYDVPYTTLHVGKMSGGVQVNIVPNHAVLDFEIRSLAGEDVAGLIGRLEAEAEAIVAPLRGEFPEAAITVERLWDYPGLGTPSDAEVVRFVKGLTGANGTMKVAFGTEGGLFDARLGVPTVICGPGSMAQGHKPDEFVSVEQIERCRGMLAALVDRLEAGF
ncbi:acetylornithine deacetylase [Rhodobacter sp. SY28-1]|uniref:acetylornithine deacetylase n=1 Tax=Rhodobacter sp. SY28-1 TaxID=2562317 RepID=UPI0023EF5434|nr:acetylornithine deacetylase [Rhodobacter sp. SY28-1]